MSDRTFQTRLGASGETSLDSVDWSFRNCDTKYLTHGLHPYPARMIPQIPNTLLSYFLSEGTVNTGDRLYDPFAGSGTSLVEARLNGLHAEGNDINPLACELTLAKSVPLAPERVREARNEVFDGLADELHRLEKPEEQDAVDRPDVNEGWFPEPQIYQLVRIRERIEGLESEYGAEVSRFFRVALSKTTRLASYQRNGEFKRYRIPEEERESHDPDVLRVFRDEVNDNVERMRDYFDRVDHTLETVVHHADSRDAAGVEDDSADIVITSPPYGDHSTTVAYGQFSMDPAIVSGNYGYEEMREVDRRGLGGKRDRSDVSVDALRDISPSLDATLSSLYEKDGRGDDAVDFFGDYFEVMEQVLRVLRPGQPVVWVVANRTMSRVNIPTHLITRELCEHLGFEHLKTVPREIPNKTMPWENAPENVEGETGDLMANENIVILTTPK